MLAILNWTKTDSLASNRNKNRHKENDVHEREKRQTYLIWGAREEEERERDWYSPPPSPLSSLIFFPFSLFSCVVAVRILFNINTHTYKKTIYVLYSALYCDYMYVQKLLKVSQIERTINFLIFNFYCPTKKHFKYINTS